MASSIEVIYIQFQVPDPRPGETSSLAPLPNPCSCGCGCPKCNAIPAGPFVPCASMKPVRYASGEIVLEATDLSVGGFGLHWGHTRSFASRLSEDTNAGNGYNWQVKEWSYLIFPTATTVAIMGQANAALWFDR